MTPDDREWWAERAAIREYMGGQDRATAEAGAMAELEARLEREEVARVERAHQLQVARLALMERPKMKAPSAQGGLFDGA